MKKDTSTYPITILLLNVKEEVLLPDIQWETTADENGEYRFEKVIMHKHCSPFHIWATYKEDRVDDEFRGELEEPNQNAIRLHNLLIKSTRDYEWHGRLTYEGSSNFNCSYYSDRQIEAINHLEEKADLKIAIEQLEFQALCPVAAIKNIELTGKINIWLDDNKEEIGTRGFIH